MEEKLQNIYLITINFLAKLRENNFSVGINTYIEVFRVIDWFFEKPDTKDIQSLKNYLAPVICKNKEELVKFESLFTSAFLKPVIKEYETKKIEDRNKKRKAILYLFTAVFDII
ncbi:MAG: hypothetical protein JWN78_998, partial [Bacteroidota bacterium]|nr:hypothetical protein [Bacteroidota bacterium]